ncbi:ribonucleotide-diphosphate reductase subunit beta [Halococcus thailandensis]|uniref:Ribonucleotide-diphosphate reductase subunit beta n=1 Tax=Halococcus thailandensis JCM 13552 TaxID=1227457 RepID=M0NHD2_9EURY|nr:ribonucleotide-diphosphate reductase subunit beta [Halococcus thailandensis]EMA56504.1 ribonucleotide-diphosphate reductase subunit beta [Halococcus thailandensis JCM 13552]
MVESTKPSYSGQRVDTDDKWYQLFQKGVELGTWNVEKLFDEIGFKQDKETWESLEDDERAQIRYLLSGFLDGETEVAGDAATNLSRAMGADCLEGNRQKEMFMTMLTLTEHKHTQFLDIYMNEVMDDRDNYAELDPRKGTRVPIVQATGLGEVFEHQGLLTAKAAQTDDPVDIARAATNYHLNVEGILARVGSTAISRLPERANLPLLNYAFKFISTDEGRHITHGVELLKELLEKEQAGKPAYQGVEENIVSTLYEDVPYMADFAYMYTDAVGDPLDFDIDSTLMRGGNLIDGMYNETLGCDIDYMQVMDNVSDRYNEISEWDLESRLEEQERHYQQKRGVAMDGGDD